MYQPCKMNAVALAVAGCIMFLSQANAAPALPKKATLSKAVLSQTTFTAPGKITFAAALTGDTSNGANCQFNANIFKTTDGDNAINIAVASGIKLAGPLPAPLVGPITADLTPGKYRVDISVDNEPSSACKGSATATFEVQRQKMGSLGVGTIGSLVILNPADVINEQEPIKFVVRGEGQACNYQVDVISPDNIKTAGRQSAMGSPGSAESIISVPFYSDGGKHGQYKLTAKAFPNDTRPGAQCLGTASANFNFVRDNKVNLGANAPMIQDVYLEPGRKIGGSTYRNDELIQYKALGNIVNSGPDVTNRCGWTAQLETKDGSSVVRVLGSHTQFGVLQNSLPLTGIETGDYRLTVKTTAADDALAKQPCLGKASKQVTIIATPGKITGVDLSSNGVMGTTSNAGYLSITPKISGPNCLYKITRKVNYVVGSDVVTYHTHLASGDAGMSLGEYGDAQTIVEVILEGSDKGGLLRCEGKVSRTIQVFDEIHKQGKVLN